MSRKLRSMYQEWFMAYQTHPDRDKHFNNIVECLKSDVELGHLKRGSEHHRALQEWFINFKESLPPIKETTPLEHAVNAVELVFDVNIK